MVCCGSLAVNCLRWPVVSRLPRSLADPAAAGLVESLAMTAGTATNRPGATHLVRGYTGDRALSDAWRPNPNTGDAAE
jgi:hypothetical protein